MIMFANLLPIAYLKNQTKYSFPVKKSCLTNYLSRQKQSLRFSSTTAASYLHTRPSAGSTLGGHDGNIANERGCDDDAAKVDKGGEEAAAPSEHQVPSRTRNQESGHLSEVISHFVRFWG